MLSLSDNNQVGIFRAFNSNCRYLDDSLNIDSHYFEQMMSDIPHRTSEQNPRWLRLLAVLRGLVLLLLNYCSMCFPLFVGVLCLYLICYALLCVHSSFTIILKSWLLCYYCLTDVLLLWLFLRVPWVGLQCVIVVFPDHTRSLFRLNYKKIYDEDKRIFFLYILYFIRRCL